MADEQEKVETNNETAEAVKNGETAAEAPSSSADSKPTDDADKTEPMTTVEEKIVTQIEVKSSKIEKS